MINRLAIKTTAYYKARFHALRPGLKKRLFRQRSENKPPLKCRQACPDTCSLEKNDFSFRSTLIAEIMMVGVWGRQGVNCCDRGVRDSSSVFTSQLNIIDLREEINQPWNVTLCPWQLNLTAFVLLRRRPPTPHSPRVIFFFFLVPCLSAPVPQQEKRRLPGDIHSPHDELSVEPSMSSLSEPPAA